MLSHRCCHMLLSAVKHSMFTFISKVTIYEFIFCIIYKQILQIKHTNSKIYVTNPNIRLLFFSVSYKRILLIKHRKYVSPISNFSVNNHFKIVCDKDNWIKRHKIVFMLSIQEGVHYSISVKKDNKSSSILFFEDTNQF